MAAHVAKYLQDLVPTRIVVGSDERVVNLNRIREKINTLNRREWDENNVVFAHVLVEFREKGKWYAFDSTDGVKTKKDHWNDSCWTRNKGHLTVEEAMALANTRSGWNSFFDRDEIPMVRRRITKFFKKLNS